MVVVIPPNLTASLIPTSEFILGKYPFENFNILQSLCYSSCFVDCNFVVSANTSSGKTIVGELIIADTIQKGKKSIFLCPLKALSDEKFTSWTDPDHFLSKYNIEIMTGDYKLDDQKLKKLQQADIIIMTSEMLDTRTRYLNNADNHWIYEVGTLIVDEAHLLHTSRGPALEVGLMRFTEYNQEARVVLLSATMTNTRELGEWLETLNNKETRMISTDWRPVELYKKYLRARGHEFSQKRIKSVQDIVAPLVCDYSTLALFATDPDPVRREVAKIRGKAIQNKEIEKEDKKTLVFVHAKEEGRKLCKELDKIGITSYFHNADLTQKDRKKLEEAFRKKDLNVLIATSTLAWGINMPAKNVIISGTMRGPTKIEDMDIAQSVGRAGRFGMYNRGDAFIICDADYKLPDSFMVCSQFNARSLTFHLIAEIYSRRVKTQKDIENWYLRTFAHKQGNIMGAKEALEKLLKCEAITLDLTTKEYSVTSLGKIARDMYINPIDVYIWKENFEQINDWNSHNQLAWALTNDITQFELDYIPKDMKQLAMLYKMACKLSPSPKNLSYGALFHYRLGKANKLYSEQQIIQLDQQIMSMWINVIRDLRRMFATVKRLNDLQKWGKDSELKTLQAQITYGVGPHLLELVSLPGIGETIANQLYEHGIDSIAKLEEGLDVLPTIIERKASVTRIKNALIEYKESLQHQSTIDFIE